MVQLLYWVIFGEMAVILSLLFKTPFRKLVLMTTDRVKRGRGPVVVKTIAATVFVVFSSALYSMLKIQKRSVGAAGALNPTDQVLMSKHLLEASLLDVRKQKCHLQYIGELRHLTNKKGFILFLSLMIDRLHHYIRELRLLRKTMEAAKKQTRSFDDGKSGNSGELKALTEEVATLRAKIKALESECALKTNKAKDAEAEVEDLKEQFEKLLMEYDRLLEHNQHLQNQLQLVHQTSSHAAS